MTTIENIIVGAGPYGLSLAAHFRREGIPFQIYGKPLESWRSAMPEGMYLKSEPFASNLYDPDGEFTFGRFSIEKGIHYQPVGKPVAIEVFLSYAEWFRRRTVGETIDIQINRIRQQDGGFVLERADGSTVACRRLILATGHLDYKVIPRELVHLTKQALIHSSSFTSAFQYAGKEIAVVGAGQSAIETAALLNEAGAKVRLIVRQKEIVWEEPSSKEPGLLNQLFAPVSGLGSGWKSWVIAEMPSLFRLFLSPEKRHRYVARNWGPSASHWLKPRVEGKVETLLGHKIRSAIESKDRVRLTLESAKGFQEITVDRVIAATGFKVDFDRISYLDEDLKRRVEREGGAPVLSSNFETSIPNLFVVGVTSSLSFGPVMRFLVGAKHSSPTVTNYVKALNRRDEKRHTLPKFAGEAT